MGLVRRSVLIPAALIALLPALPIGVALASWLSPSGEAWTHIVEHVLLRVGLNTLFLAAGVAVLTSVLGISLAWLCANCEFPGRRFFSWALLLPLAIPGYVLAFALSSVFGVQGSLHQLAMLVGVGASGWPSANGGVASVLCLGLSLYPYVFLLSRQAFVSQGMSGFEVAQSLGLSPVASFFRVSLPGARPWIIGGLSLVIMETLADFGTVRVLNFDTLTSAIYSAWYGLYALDAALQLSTVLLVFVVLAIWLERKARGRAQFHLAADRPRRSAIVLKRWHALLATVFAGSVFACGFGLPVLKLAVQSTRYMTSEFNTSYFDYVWHSLALGVICAAILIVLALVLALCARRYASPAMTVLRRIATLGYALPGTVLAVGFFVPIAASGRILSDLVTALTGTPVRLVLTGGLLTLLLGLCARFLAVAYQPLENGLLRVTRNIEDAARGLGVTRFALIRKVHLPMLTPAMATAGLLVFVDVMKELPITLMTRPFGWDTLSVRVFQMTTEGEWERAALPALTIVAAGLIPILLINRRSIHRA